MRTLILIFLLALMTHTLIPAVTAQDCMPSRLEIGSEAQVTPGASNRIRAEPNTGAEQIGQIPGGGIVTIVDGSDCVAGFLWWQITYDGIIGWTVEASDSEYFLEPYSDEVPATDTSDDSCDMQALLQIGDYGQTSSNTPGRLRAEPGINAEQIGQVNPIDIFLVVDGFVCADGFLWWQVEVNDSIGWMAEGNTENYFVQEVTDLSLIPSTPEPTLISHDISWNADSSRLAIATSIGVLIYNTNDWLQEPYLLDDGILATDLAFSPVDPDLIVINGEEVLIRFRAYHLSDDSDELLFERLLMDGPMGGDSTAYNFAFSADGNQLSFGGSSYDVYDTETWTQINTFENLAEAGNHYRRIDISHSDLSSTGDYGAGIVSNGVQLYDLSSSDSVSPGEIDPRISVFDRGGRTQGITALQFSPDDTQLITGDNTGSLQMWDVETGERTSFIRAENQGSISNRINDIAFHPDSDIIATAESDPRGIVRIFTSENLETQLVFDADVNHQTAYTLAYSPDGETLVVIMDDVIYLLETTDYTIIDRITIQHS